MGAAFVQYSATVLSSSVTAFSMASVRSSDAPETRLASPNGLYAEEACQLARFAGLSDKLSVFQIFDLILLLSLDCVISIFL